MKKNFILFFVAFMFVVNRHRNVNATEFRPYVGGSLAINFIKKDDELYNPYSPYLDDTNDNKITGTLSLGVKSKFDSKYSLRLEFYKTFGNMINEKGNDDWGTDNVEGHNRNGYALYAKKKFGDPYGFKLHLEYEFMKDFFGSISYGLGMYNFSYRYKLYNPYEPMTIFEVHTITPDGYRTIYSAQNGGRDLGSGEYKYSEHKLHHSLGIGTSYIFQKNFEFIGYFEWIFGRNYSKNKISHENIGIEGVGVLGVGVNYYFF